MAWLGRKGFRGVAIGSGEGKGKGRVRGQERKVGEGKCIWEMQKDGRKERRGD